MDRQECLSYFREKAWMKSVVVVGAQWGDEGKGKVVDYLAGSFDYIARVAGGHNAGHTVIIGKDRYVLQLIPCGILRPKQQAVIGTGTVVDPAALVAEIATLSKAGIDVKGRLHVSNRAQLIFPYHRELDKAAEGARGANKIGTTSRGIGPAYEDKMARRGLRMCDLLEPELFRNKAAHVVAEKNRLAKGAYGADIDFSHEVEETLKLGEQIRGYICDTAELLNRALDEGKSVLFEGAQGTMLDIDHGTYPFVTSSSATSGGGRDRRGSAADEAQTRAGDFQGVHDARGQRSVSDGDAGPGCARSARARERVRSGDRAAAAVRVAGSASAAVRENDQRNRFAGDYEAGRV